MRRKIFPAVFLLCLWILFSAWGIQGHWKINEKTPASFSAHLAFLKATWPGLLALHASDADDRKKTDPEEARKHYIDLDSYPEFLQTGRIPQTLDSVIALHGYGFVMDAGILPWTILSVFDSLKNSFIHHDWNKSVLFASDLGHYTGDGHQPLHITKNYNGQLTGQSGIHSRYETNMISRFYDQLSYSCDSALYIEPAEFVFSFLYRNYKCVDSLLLADLYAKSVAGNTSSDAYYNALWLKSGNFTIRLLKDASFSTATLIYTAWKQAGSPGIYPDVIPEHDGLAAVLDQNYPNPFTDFTSIRFSTFNDNTYIEIRIYDQAGHLMNGLLSGEFTPGFHVINWDGRSLRPGIYFVVLRSGSFREVRKIVRSR